MFSPNKLFGIWIRRLYRLIYWIAPPVLLFFILSRIDFSLFCQILSHVNVWLLALGLSYYPAVVLVSGIRWRVALAEYVNIRPPLTFLVRHYWIGMVVGYFSPGQLGLDAYRIVVVGRRYQHYLQVIFAILVEKVMALLNAVLLVICLYPVVKSLIVRQSPALDQIARASYFVAVAALAMMSLGFEAARHRLAKPLINGISALLQRFINRMRGVAETDRAATEARDPSKIMALMSNPKTFILVFTISLAIQFLSAVGNQIIFCAVGYNLPFVVNLFVTPIFYFIFLLPISFGSLGIREGAYILLYGFFGVPPEIALLVSFINLSGILINNAIGAALIWGRRRDDGSHSAPEAGLG
jgi:uncharacterized protein (TIRG00374 family)